MFSNSFRGWIFCVCLALTNAKPLKHYGRCQVDKDVGYCLPRADCWENIPHNSGYDFTRSRCTSFVVNDLICCRRKPAESSSKPSTTIRTTSPTPIWTTTLKPIRTTTPAPVELPTPDVCGFSFADRIFYGTQAHIKEYPWMALLAYTYDDIEYSHKCGGSLIHERWVVTAAHCVPAADDSSRLARVRLGEWNTTSAPDCQQFRHDKICAPLHLDVPIDRVIVHELYSPLVRNFPHDIALLRLTTAVGFDEYVTPICLPAANENAEHAYADHVMDMAGWGNTETIHFGGSPIKLKTMLRAISSASCRRVLRDLNVGQLCAGGDTRASSCHGDSGGPLMHLTDNGVGGSSYYLTGIVSLGTANCNNRGQAIVFTKVEQYVPWMRRTINANAL